MAHETEAACLLRSGSMYPIRVGLKPSNSDPIFLGIKPGAISIYFGDAPIYHFDLDGRWQRAFVDGLHYLKGLDTAVHTIDRVREGENLVLRRRALSFAETVDLDEHLRSMAIGLIVGLGGSLEPIDPPPGCIPLTIETARTLVERIALWDTPAWFAHRERYLGTYGPIPFIPPDASHPVILQATLGHERGPGFGGENPATYYERSSTEFAEHARTVAGLLGRRAIQCRQVYLAGADAMRRPLDAILADLDIASGTFAMSDGRPRPRARDVNPLDDAPSLDGVHAFLHEFDRPTPDPTGWDALRARHFRRLIVGIESGSKRVRSLYGRDWNDDGLRDWVASCPVGLGLVVVVGAGGRDFADDHVEATARLVGSLSIGAGSLVTLVDADELDTRPTDTRGFEPLDTHAMSEQRVDLKSRLAAALSPRKVKVATYSVEKRWQ